MQISQFDITCLEMSISFRRNSRLIRYKGSCSVLLVSRSLTCSTPLCFAATIILQNKRKSEPRKKRAGIFTIG